MAISSDNNKQSYAKPARACCSYSSNPDCLTHRQFTKLAQKNICAQPDNRKNKKQQQRRRQRWRHKKWTLPHFRQQSTWRMVVTPFHAQIIKKQLRYGSREPGAGSREQWSSLHIFEARSPTCYGSQTMGA